MTMKLYVKLQMIAITPKYKTNQYYKEFVTQKTLETKHKALNKHYYKFYIIAWSDGNT